MNKYEMEVYKPIKHFPNYEVSNTGNVRNIITKNILKLLSCPKTGNYTCYTVILYNNTRKQGYNKKIHRLVGEAFIPNPDNKPIVDHIDRNSANNHVSNLRWATHSENNMNKNMMCTNKLGHKNICLKRKKYLVRIKRITVGLYQTLEEAIKARDDYLNSL